MDIDPRTSVHTASLLAAIDIGSNSFRLEIGQIVHGRYRRIDYLKETVRLGGGLDAHGMLTDEAAQRGLDCLARFARRLAGFAPSQVRAVATQTLREARNRDAFLLRAQGVLGLPIEVISGREEARLIYVGVAHLQPTGTGRRLVVDIGGRSTEMIIGQSRTPIVAESFRVGSVSLSQRFFGDGRLTETAFRAAQVAAGAELEEALATFSRGRWRESLGSSGTVSAVSQLLAASEVTRGEITPAGLRWCIARCIDAGHVERLNLPGLRDDRRPVLAGGLSILYTLSAHFGIDALRPTRGALRQGVIVDLHDRQSARQRARGADMRDHSVAGLQRRFGVDTGQAQRVRSVALALYDQLGGTDTEARRELAWACDLHEIGMMVSHHDHHRHSAYLLAHVDAPGFSQSQQRRIGELVLGQRGGLRKIEQAFVSDGFTWQVLCLRLAVIKCHARGDVSTQVLRLAREGRRATLAFGRVWAQAHPRTEFLLQEEAETWNRSGPLQLVLVS